MSVITEEIMWQKGLESARRAAVGTDRLVLLFFHYPGCGGCAKTMEGTFPDQGVRELVHRDFIPVAIAVTEAPETAKRFKVEWTPTFVIADGALNELERWVGFLPPKDFVAQAYLSEGLAFLHRERYKDAEGAFGWLVENMPDSHAAPQARYYLGVALYKDTGDPEHLEMTWDAMHRRYPDDQWTLKASAWSG